MHRRMASRRRALVAWAAASAVVAAVVAGGLGAAVLYSADSPQPWQTVRTGITVHGTPAYIGRCVALDLWCGVGIQGMSLGVSLIRYNGTYYYVHTGEFSFTELQNDSTTVLSQTAGAYTAWFTNSTLYCVTPYMGTAPITCPG